MPKEDKPQYKTAKLLSQDEIDAFTTAMRGEELKKELKNLSPEDKEKIGWGLNTIGFKVEKAKNDFFANVFDPKTDKLLSKIDKKSTLGRFCTELRNSFIRDAEIARKKAVDLQQGKEKAKLKNLSLFTGNILRYGRIVTDLTGASLASPLRYVMMAGMATTRLAEAGKEAHLKNENVIKKTRIGKAEYGESEEEQKQKEIDVGRAYEEAQRIYERAQQKEGNKNVSVEALKNAYLTEMPKDLQERLKNPSTANNFIQKNLKKRLEVDIKNINDSIEKIERNKKFTLEQKESGIEKLITKQKKNLEDYDRILTQYGTVDALAMAGRYAQTVGKAVVAVVTVETLVLSAEKLFETMSNHFHGTPAVPSSGASTPKGETVVPPVAAPEQPSTSAAGSPETPPAIEKFVNDGIKFEKGKGGIQGILDLKEQIRTEYDGDYSKAPESVRDFMNTDATKEAIKLGLFDPNNPDGKESALIQAGSILKFDENGNLLFGKPDASGNIPTLEKYEGKMFDSDHSTDHSTGVTRETIEPKPTTEKTLEDIEKQLDEKAEKYEKEISNEPSPVETLKKEIEAKIDAGTNLDKPGLGYQTVSTGTEYGVGSKIEIGSVVKVGSEVPIGNSIQTGSAMQTGEMTQPGGYYGNQSIDVYGYRDSFGRYHDISGKIYFPELSSYNNAILHNHPEFGDNHFGLAPNKLIEAYGAGYKNMEFLFGKDTTVWQKLGNLKAKNLLEHVATADDKTAEGRLALYLNMLKEYTGLKPESGFLWANPESSQYYIARALQKLTAGQGKASLEQFGKDLRK